MNSLKNKKLLKKIKKSWDQYKINSALYDDNKIYKQKGVRPKNLEIFEKQNQDDMFIVTTAKNDKFNIINKEIRLTDSTKFSSSNFKEANASVNKFIGKLHSTLVDGMEKDDKIFTTFFHPSLDMPISIPFMTNSNFTPDLIEKEFIKVCQSKRTLQIDQNLEIRSKIAKIATGSGSDNDDLFAKNTSIIKILNNDNFCAVRAFLIAKFINDGHARIYNLCRKNNKELDLKTKELVEQLGLENKPCGIRELTKIESYFKDYNLTVFDESNCSAKNFIPMYTGPILDQNKFIYLLLYKKHFYVIKSPARFFNFKKYCNYCKTPFNYISFHKCNSICFCCKSKECKSSTALYVKCNQCDLNCFNQECLEKHKMNICIPKKICIFCETKYTYKHVCQDEKKFCSNCSKQVDYDHRCFILREELKVDKRFKGYIFFDYEASQDTGVHLPNLVIAHKYNDLFVLVEKKFFYNEGDDINNLFCKWLFEQKHYIAIAHNFKGYDGVFIMNYLLNNIRPDKKPPQIVNQGNKILSLSFNDLKIIDSLMFLPMPLSEFSKTFKIQEVKGYFPHFFNTKKNQNYIGKYPDIKYYGSQHFCNEEKLKFDRWYNLSKELTFNFKNELFDYCDKDVNLLANGCISFIKIIKEKTNIDPFLNSTTLASLCHVIYRQNYMIQDSIAIIPEYGYNPYQNSSKKAKLWLKYISASKNIQIEHAQNGFEHKIGTFKLDGFCDGIGYEFHGCLYHGCMKCYSPRSFNPIKQETMLQTYEKHKNRIEFIKNKIPVVEIWECEWNKMVKEDENVKKFVENELYRDPLNPRDALFGGRTNAAKLYHKINESEKIYHYDFTSLYPSVQRDNLFPVGSPEIITEQFKSVDSYFGLIKCLILPPRNMYFPVLPVKVNNKLIFPLCMKCSLLMSKSNCNHNNNERALDGTWCTEEVKYALKYNYKILYIFEIYHWENRSNKMFNGYINSFLKLKQESSGYPSWVKTDKDIELYQQKYFDNEGIMLDVKNINLNSGLRKISKLLLNTLWGRFGMNTNRTKLKIINDKSEWNDMISNEQLVIHDVHQSNPEILQVVYSELKEMHSGGNQTNVPLAVFTTAYARLKLLKYLIKLDRRVLYFDTDSIVFISDTEFEKSENHPQLGDYLGNFTDELNGRYITEFISAGAKNYAKLLNDGSSECVVKGFTLSHIASLEINFESMKNLVLNESEKSIFVNQTKITRNKKNWNLNTCEIEKTYSMVYDKRILLDDFTTLPYGYVEN